MRIKVLGNAGLMVKGTSIVIQIVGLGVRFDILFFLCGLCVNTGEHGPPK